MEILRLQIVLRVCPETVLRLGDRIKVLITVDLNSKIRLDCPSGSNGITGALRKGNYNNR